MKTLLFWVSLAIALLTITACSSTTLTESWKNPEYHQRVNRVYIIGVSKQETHRRLFEDEFASYLQTYGVTGIPSYRDMPDAENVDKKTIDAKLLSNKADAVLITRVLGKRTEETVYPGHAIYRTWPYHYGPRIYDPAPYYHNYWSYFDHRYDMIYTPATVARYQVITAECNLYDTKSGDLIWSAQLETVVEDNFQKRMKDFIETVTNDLAKEGLI